MVVCPNCGSTNPEHVFYCGKCGAEIPRALREGVGSASDATLSAEPQPGIPDDPAASAASVHWGSGTLDLRPASQTLSIAGMCAIIAGLFAVIQGVAVMFTGAVLVVFNISGTEGLIALQVVVGIVEIVLGIYSIRGGFSARGRRGYRRALIGAILGMVAFGFAIGGFLGLVAVILIALCRDEFGSQGRR